MYIYDIIIIYIIIIINNNMMMRFDDDEEIKPSTTTTTRTEKIKEQNPRACVVCVCMRCRIHMHEKIDEEIELVKKRRYSVRSVFLKGMP